MLPTFIVIGASKCGTTSLWHYLASHPEVCVSRTKEPSFFVEELNWHRGFDWYERQFDPQGGALAIGECSGFYTRYPRFRGVPERIAAAVPDARLVYLVRDPIERMLSNYLHRVRVFKASDPVDVALRADPDYLNTSRYAFQVERYLEHFAEDQLLVVVSERLRDEPAPTLRKILAFLGVDPTWAVPNANDRHNVGGGAPYRTHTLHRVRRSHAMRRLVPRLPAGVRSVARTALQSPVPDATISPELEHELRDVLREDVRRLYRYVDGPFDGWGIA